MVSKGQALNYKARLGRSSPIDNLAASGMGQY